MHEEVLFFATMFVFDLIFLAIGIRMGGSHLDKKVSDKLTKEIDNLTKITNYLSRLDSQNRDLMKQLQGYRMKIEKLLKENKMLRVSK